MPPSPSFTTSVRPSGEGRERATVLPNPGPMSPPSANAADASAAVADAVRNDSLVDPLIWKACAGGFVQIPDAGNRVYYFPEGHIEHASSTPDLSSVRFYKSQAFTICRVSYVQYFTDGETDEVFVKIGLVPEVLPPGATELPPEPPSLVEDLNKDSGMVSFAKMLTKSDANNGGGFSVPRFCADTVFPPLNFSDDPPVQKLSIRDVHGVVFEFRHIYRGTPRRHLLTTGWSKFVNHKKLVHRDVVVFIRNKYGELFVGVRRRVPEKKTGMFNYASSDDDSGDGSGGGDRFSSRGVTAESVVEAVQLAELSRPFEITYYPRAWTSNFVVKVEKVYAGMTMPWTLGSKVRIAMESDDSGRTSWQPGVVNRITATGSQRWSFSPWRMLQVDWSQPMPDHATKVSPWEVEMISEIPHIPASYSPTKVPTGGQGNMLYPTLGFNSTADNAPTVFPNNTFPVGIQGARQDPVQGARQDTVPVGIQGARQDPASVFGLCTEPYDGQNKRKSSRENISPEENHVCSGSAADSDSLTPVSQGSMSYSDGEPPIDLNCHVDKKKKLNTFRLFGNTIQAEHLVDSHYNVINGSEDVNDPSKFPYLYPEKQVHGSPCHEDPDVGTQMTTSTVDKDTMDCSLNL